MLQWELDFIEEFEQHMNNNPNVTELDLTQERLSDSLVNYLCELIDGHHTIAKVYFSGTSLSDGGLRQICKTLLRNENVMELDLGENKFSPKGLKYIQTLIKLNTNLRYIDMENCNLTYADASDIYKALSNNHTIFDMSFDGNVDFLKNTQTVNAIVAKLTDNRNSHAVTTLVNCVRNQTGISTETLTRVMRVIIIFSLENNYSFLGTCSKYVSNLGRDDKNNIAKFLNAQGVFGFVMTLKTPLSGRDICLAGMILTAMYIEILSEILSKNMGITKLDLSGIKIDLQEVEVLAKHLTANTELERLDLSDMDPNYAALLLESVKDIKSLKGLNLSGVRLNDNTVRCIANMLKSEQTQLVVLDLSNTHISFNGLKMLTNALAGNTRLKGLDLSDNPITQNAWSVLQIKNMVMGNKGLTVLGLNNCALQQKHIQLLKPMLGNLEIELDGNIGQLNNTAVSAGACVTQTYNGFVTLSKKTPHSSGKNTAKHK